MIDDAAEVEQLLEGRLCLESRTTRIRKKGRPRHAVAVLWTEMFGQWHQSDLEERIPFSGSFSQHCLLFERPRPGELRGQACSPQHLSGWDKPKLHRAQSPNQHSLNDKRAGRICQTRNIADPPLNRKSRSFRPNRMFQMLTFRRLKGAHLILSSVRASCS